MEAQLAPESAARAAGDGGEAPVVPAPCSLVIFGGGGDLARRKVLPALYNLALDGLLPADFAVIGSARKEREAEEYRAFAHEGIAEHSRRPPDVNVWSALARNLFYLPGAVEDPAVYAAIRRRLKSLEIERSTPGNRIFYLALPPSHMAMCVKQLRAAGLIGQASPPWARVIVEKPIGRDLASARRLNAGLARALRERDIFRIDHYLGKETVRNLLVLRFANSIFEPLWNQKYVDHVQITVAEEEGVGARADYYEEAGALRDIVQNHMLQLLSLIAMEPPWDLRPDVVRDHRLAVLRSLRPMEGAEVGRCAVRAQYGPGGLARPDALGYRGETGVRPDSTTETFVALKVLIDNWRWAGVPFYLRTGRRMPKRATEIAVQFKEVPAVLFNTDARARLQPNVLALRIQPDEGFSFRISAKVPGQEVLIRPVDMDFSYGKGFGGASPEAYERLLLDVMIGDSTLFIRRDAVEASWAWIMPILEAWRRSGETRLPEYAAGTWGPAEADRLIEADGRRWRTL